MKASNYAVAILLGTFLINCTDILSGDFKAKQLKKSQTIDQSGDESTPLLPPSPLPPPTPGGSGDQTENLDPQTFNWSQVQVLPSNESDIGSWSKTSTPLEVWTSASEVYFRHDKISDWMDRARWVEGDEPSPDYVFWGNLWLIVKLNGQIYATTIEWMHDTAYSRSVARDEFWNGPPSGGGPLSQWAGPSDGQVIGFMVSTRARFSSPPNGVRERSPVVFVRYNSSSIAGNEN